MKTWVKGTSFVLLVGLGIVSIAYILWSRGNPYVIDIVLGSIIFSLLFGVVSTLFQNLVDKSFKGRSVLLGIIASCLLIMLVALLVYSSGAPRAIRDDFVVTYLVDPDTCNLLGDLPGIPDDVASICYDDACRLLRAYVEDIEDVNDPVRRMIREPFSAGGGPVRLSKVFHDLTEYLVAYYLSHSFSTNDIEMEKALHRRDAGAAFALPHLSIGGESEDFNDIEGEFEKNEFNGLNWVHVDTGWDFRMPKNTVLRHRRVEGAPASEFVIENRFVTIRIGIRFMMASLQGYGHLRESQTGASYRAVRKLDTYVFYDAEFSRFRHGYRDMPHHEKWAGDLLALLKRKFAWGDPPLASRDEVTRYFRQLQRAQEPANSGDD